MTFHLDICGSLPQAETFIRFIHVHSQRVKKLQETTALSQHALQAALWQGKSKKPALAKLSHESTSHEAQNMALETQAVRVLKFIV